MSRSTPKTPNISAIEDRAIDRAERMERIRAEMRAEAAQRVERLSIAQSTGTVARSILPPPGRRSDDVEHLILGRDPCARCGTRRDKHDQFGCKRWRG